MRTFLKIIIFLLVLILIGFAVYVAFFQNKNPSGENNNITPIGSVSNSNGLPIADQQVFTPRATTTLVTPEENFQPANSLISELGANEISTSQMIAPLLIEPAVVGTSTASTTEPYLIYLGQNKNGIYKKTLGNSEPEKIAELETVKIKKVVWALDKQDFKLFTLAIDGKTNLIKMVTWPEATTTLPNGNIYDLAVSPNQKQLFYLEEKVGETFGYLTDLEFKKKELVFTSPFTSWHVNWFTPGAIAFAGKASNQALGLVYFLDLKTKKLTRVLGDRLGLSVLPSLGGTHLALSQTEGRQTRLSFYDLKKSEVVGPTLNTLAEKCVWADNEIIYCAVPKTLPAGDYPDSWYRGEINFADEIWRANITTGETKRISVANNLTDLSENNFDAENLFLNQEATTLFLLNRLNSRLMAFDLKETL
ncbi:MAG: hypothetical protein AAB453_01095 [Patescibacteria group bacterium]